MTMCCINYNSIYTSCYKSINTFKSIFGYTYTSRYTKTTFIIFTSFRFIFSFRNVFVSNQTYQSTIFINYWKFFYFVFLYISGIFLADIQPQRLDRTEHGHGDKEQYVVDETVPNLSLNKQAAD